jgi:hypothetical protein
VELWFEGSLWPSTCIPNTRPPPVVAAASCPPLPMEFRQTCTSPSYTSLPHPYFARPCHPYVNKALALPALPLNLSCPLLLTFRLYRLLPLLCHHSCLTLGFVSLVLVWAGAVSGDVAPACGGWQRTVACEGGQWRVKEGNGRRRWRRATANQARVTTQCG